MLIVFPPSAKQAYQSHHHRRHRVFKQRLRVFRSDAVLWWWYSHSIRGVMSTVRVMVMLFTYLTSSTHCLTAWKIDFVILYYFSCCLWFSRTPQLIYVCTYLKLASRCVVSSEASSSSSPASSRSHRLHKIEFSYSVCFPKLCSAADSNPHWSLVEGIHVCHWIEPRVQV